MAHERGHIMDQVEATLAQYSTIAHPPAPSTLYDAPTMWMIHLRIRPTPGKPQQLRIYTIMGEREEPGSSSLQQLLADVLQRSNAGVWYIQRNSTQRLMPPPLTVEIPEAGHKYVLDFSNDVVQWFKEPLVHPGPPPYSPNHWFFPRPLQFTTANEVFLLESLQKYLFPITSVFKTDRIYRCNIVGSMELAPTGYYAYIHTTMWTYADTLLADFFQQVSGARLNECFGFRQGTWVGAPPQLAPGGPLYSYVEACASPRTLETLGWQMGGEVWLIPVKVGLKDRRAQQQQQQQ